MFPISIREQLLQTTLETLKPVAEAFGATLFRSPVVAIERDVTPSIIVFPEEETVETPKNMWVERRLVIRVVALARELESNVAEIVADQLITACHAALMANRNLGGRCQGIKELGSDWNIEDADATAAAIPARYEISYRTAVVDLTKSA
jgi:hypothetical protein